MKERFVKFCPKCKSLDVHTERSNPLQPVMGLPAFHFSERSYLAGLLLIFIGLFMTYITYLRRRTNN